MPLQDRQDEVLVRRAFVQFALISVGLIALVIGGVYAVAEAQAGRSAAEEASTRGEIVAEAVADGLAEPGVADDPDFALEIEATARHAGVRAVMVWDAAGTVVWSTRSVFLGESYRLDPEVQEIFGTEVPITTPDGERLDSARPRGLFGNEVEVFSPIEDATGTPLVVESYVDPSALSSTRAETLRVLLPIGAVGLLLFEGMALLAGARLARRVQASRRERIKLLTDALSALDHERRRIAHDLHDGIVQDLAAMRYALTAVMQSVPDDLEGDPRGQMQRICDVVEEELVSLRGTLGELLPVEPLELPLEQTVRELVARLVPSTISWTVEVEPALEPVEPASAELVHRIVQEGVRNAVRHARPRTITVRVRGLGEPPGSEIRVVVDDDGRGPSPADAVGTSGGLHVGVRLLRDLVRDLGGDLSLEDRPGGGARLVAAWSRPEPSPDGSTVVGAEVPARS